MSEEGDWREAFRQPPAAYAMGQGLISGYTGGDRPAWTLDDIRQIHRQGYGAIMISAHPEGYLESRKWWGWLREGVEEAARLGLKVWIWDERGYPSGAAGGLILAEHPDWQARGLLGIMDRLMTDAQAFREGLAIPSEIMPHDVIYACAVPADAPDPTCVVPLPIQGAKVMVGNLPEGEWCLFIFAEHLMHEGTFAVGNAAGEHLYVNLLEPGIGQRFVELTHEAYRANLGDSFAAVEAFFTDEPMLMTAPFPVHSSYPSFPSIPWVSDLATEFRRRAGYDLLPCLPALFADLGPRTAEIRWHFYRCVTEMMVERYFQPIQAWCHRHGVLASGHLLGEESLVTHTAFSGEMFRPLACTDAPGIDLLSATTETFRSRDQTLPAPKVGSSVAHCHGKPMTVTEASAHYQLRSQIPISFAQRRASVNWQYVLGVNRYFSFFGWPDLADDDARRLNSHVARLSYILSGGAHIADIAVLYPITTVWGHYVPSTQVIMVPPIGGADRPKIWSEDYAPDASHWDIGFQHLVWGLLEHQRDLDIVDDSAMADGELVDGRLNIADERYRALVLPPMDVIDGQSLDKALQFARAGGLVLGFYPLPTKSAQRGQDHELRDVAAMLFGNRVPLAGEYAPHRVGQGQAVLVTDMEGLLSALDDLVPADVMIEPQTRNVFALHRRKEGREIYLLTNNGAEPQALTVTLRAEGRVEIWEPTTGAISTAEGVERIDGGSRLPLILDSYDGVFVIIETGTY